MNSTVSNIDKFHGTKKGKLVFGALELLVSYLVVSRAIETGSLWEYLIALLFFIGGLNNLIRVLGRQVKPDAKGKAKNR